MTSGRHSPQRHTLSQVTRTQPKRRGTWKALSARRPGREREHSHECGLRPLSLPVREVSGEMIGLIFDVCRTCTRGFGRIRAMQSCWMR